MCWLRADNTFTENVVQTVVYLVKSHFGKCHRNYGWQASSRTPRKTACVQSGKYSGVLAELFCVLRSEQPYSTHLRIDILNSGWEKVLYLNTQLGIQEIVTALLPFKSMERILVWIMLKIWPLKCFLHSRSEFIYQVFFGLFPGAKYLELTELKRQSRWDGEGVKHRRATSGWQR